MSALIVIDMQYDFCDGGPLAHNKSLMMIPQINMIRDNHKLIIFTKKQLQYNHSIFKNFGGSMISHCISGSRGEKLHDDLIVKSSDIIINRGTLQQYDSNSAFYDAESLSKMTRLYQILKAEKICELYFCGNGIDNVIYSTIIDALNFRFKCYVYSNVVTHVNEKSMNECITQLREWGIIFITHSPEIV